MRVTIDNQALDVAPGTTVLEAARLLEIDIPTLCFREGFEPSTSCFLCVVEIAGKDSFQPACATRCTEGMRVQTNTPEIRSSRKTALELLLSDHAGCCVARCTMGCPADLDIPGFMAELQRERPGEALRVIRQRLALPAVLGRICPAFCENPCGRRHVDEAVSIRALHGWLAEADLKSGAPDLPHCAAPTGKRVAVVGAGPAGMSAAFYLLQQGHACAVFDAAGRPGGLLRQIPELNSDLIDAETGLIERLGAEFHMNWRLGRNASLDELRREFDAVLLAFGAGVGGPTEQRRVDAAFLESLGLAVTRRGAEVNATSLQTNFPGVFAAGEIVSGKTHSVRAMAAGRVASEAIGQLLRGEDVRGVGKPFYFFHGTIPDEEAEVLYGGIAKAPRLEARADGLTQSDALKEAGRCLLCGCAKEDVCALRRYASEYGANGHRFKGERRILQPDNSHGALGFEPGKCILCGMCLEVARNQDEPMGLCFTQRGFATRVSPAFGEELVKGVVKDPKRYAENCPTGALFLKG